MDGVAAAVGRVPAALEQARALQVVDHRHQPARIEAHPFPQLLLGAAGATISEVEKREVRGSEPERLERLREAERLRASGLAQKEAGGRPFRPRRTPRSGIGIVSVSQRTNPRFSGYGTTLDGLNH